MRQFLHNRLVRRTQAGQRAVELARHHRIAAVQMKDGSAKYILKAEGAKDRLRGGYSAWLLSPCPDDENAINESLLEESDDRSAFRLLFDAWGEIPRW